MILGLGNWLEKNEEEIIRRWLDGVLALDLSHYSGLSTDALAEELLPFYRLVVSAVAEEGDIPAEALNDWVLNQRMSRSCNLPELLDISFQLRAAIGLVLLESSDAWRALGTWQDLFPYFDAAATALAEFFTQAIEETLLERLADAELMASRLAQANEEADRALMQLKAMYDVSRVLGASLDVKKTLELVVEMLAEVTEVDHCAIWLARDGYLVAEAAHGLADGELEMLRVPLSGSPSRIRDAFCTAEVASLNVAADNSPLDENIVRMLGITSMLVMPLTLKEETIGVVTLDSHDRESPLAPAQVDLMESIVIQAAVAVKNAYLYEEVQELNLELENRIAARTRELAAEKERAEALYELTRELSTSLDLDRVFRKALDMVSSAVGASHGSIMLLDPETNVLRFRAILGREKPLPRDGELTPFKAGVGLAGWVVEHRKPVLVDDVTKDERWIVSAERGTRIRSLIAAPLMVGGDVHGVLTISDSRPGYFTEAHQRLVTAAASQVANAVNNAELYRYVSDQAKRLGKMLRQQQQESSKNQAILESIADAVIVSDAKGRIALINAAAEHILGTSAAAVVGQDVRNVFAVFAPQGRSDVLAAIESLATGPAPAAEAGSPTVQTILEIDNRVVSAHLAPVMANDEFLGTVTVFRDITKEVEADRAKSEFVSTVSHELRTPMTSIKGYTDLLYAGAVGQINEEQRRFLNIIKSNADRLTALINDLLDISRMETGRVKLDLKPLPVADVVREVTDSLRGQAEEKGLTLVLDIPPDLPDVRADRNRIIQVLTNLISNAYHYTPEGGRVTVSLCEVEGDTLRVDVADTGIGISAEDQVRIFDRFYRAAHPLVEETGGTGLGLSIVKMFIEMHGGRIWVDSQLGQGSTFTFILPTLKAFQPEPEETVRAVDRGRDERPSTRKILVVDDDQDIASLIRHQLERDGYEVLITPLGTEVVSLAQREQPDLITLDILLPDRDGFDVLRELKSNVHTSDIPVIVVSVVQDEESGYQLGAVDYVTKPIDRERLLESMRAVLSRKGRVLIVEDDPDTAGLLRRTLARNGFVAEVATGGYEAMSAVRRRRPDLILLDLKLPGMDGYETLERLGRDESTDGIPIIAVSAHATDEAVEREMLLRMGAAAFLPKPFDLDELLENVERVLNGNRAPA